MARNPVAERRDVGRARHRVNGTCRAGRRLGLRLPVLTLLALAALGLGPGEASARALRQHHQGRFALRFAGTHGAPALWLSAGTLHWSATASSHQYVESRTVGAATTYVVIAGTANTPPPVAGATVTYQVRPRYQAHAWSNAVKITYTRSKRVHEGGETTREREAREARERAEREAKETAEREARERAEREAKEKAEREAKELAEREQREREERERIELEEHKGSEEPRGAVVGKAPVGPAAPASGWHLAYGDAFGAPLGSGAGHDNTLESNEKWNGCCTNSNEVAVEQRSQDRIGPEGLELVCSVGSFTVEGHTRGASCGGLRGRGFFQFAPSAVGEWAVEIDMRWPVCNGGADPGWWIYPSSTGEIDFIEGWCWPAGWRPATSWAGAEAGIPVLVGQGRHEIYPVSLGLGFEPALAFHRYTTVFVPEGAGKYDVREYVDGVFRWDTPGCALSSSYAGLILTNGLRENVQADVMTVRSIAFWQDGAHAGQGTTGGGIAPGTTVG